MTKAVITSGVTTVASSKSNKSDGNLRIIIVMVRSFLVLRPQTRKISVGCIGERTSNSCSHSLRRQDEKVCSFRSKPISFPTPYS